VGKVDVVAIGVIQVTTITAAYVAIEIDHVVADDDGFVFRSDGWTKLKHSHIIGVARHVHDIVFDDTIVANAEQVDGVVIGEHIVVVVDGVAPDGHMVGEGDVNAFEGLVGKSAVLYQHAIVVLIDVVSLIVETNVSVDKFAVNKLVVDVLPVA
jgi:hypothetical protein